MQRAALRVVQPVRDRRGGADPEAGGQDDRVHLGGTAVTGDDGAAVDPDQPAGVQAGVRRAHRRQVGVRDERALAGVVEVRGEAGAQLRIRDLCGQVPPADPGQRVAQGPGPPGRREQLRARVDQVELHLGQGGAGGQRATGPPADRVLRLRHDPRRGALEHVQLGDLRLQLGDQLDGGGAGTHHGDPPAGEIGRVVPAGGVEHRAVELGEAGHVGQLRVGDQAGRADQDVGGVPAERGVDQPVALGVVPPCGVHVGAEPDVLGQPGGAGQPARVVLHLVTGRVQVRPVRVGHRAELVERRGGVDADARVGVVPPHPADVVGPLQQHEVVHAPAEQRQPDRQPGETGADDGDPRVPRRGPGRECAGVRGGRIGRSLERRRLGRHAPDGKGCITVGHARAVRLTALRRVIVAGVTPTGR